MKLTKLTLVVLGFMLSLSHSASARDIDERQASKLAQKKYSAQKLLKVEPITSRGTKVFKVKLLVSNGRLKTVYVDSKSGKITENKP